MIEELVAPKKRGRGYTTRDTNFDYPGFDFAGTYKDTGCAISRECLNCPVPVCIEEEGSAGGDAAILAAWDAGLRLPGLWQAYRGPYRRVPRDVLEEHGIRAPRGIKNLNDGVREAAIAAIQDGMSTEELCLKHRVSSKTAIALRREAGAA